MALALQPRRSSTAPLVALAAITAVLYLAREVLIPLALAILFSFLLAPAVRRLELWRIGRAPSTLAVTGLAVAVLVLVGWSTASELVSLIAKLPEYRQNIERKLESLRSTPSEGELGKAARAIKELETRTRPDGEPSPKPPASAKPLPTTPLELIGAMGVPLLTLLALALAVLVLTIMMLLQRDDLRDRLIRLAGAGRINATTQAISDAAGRVSRYLAMQLLVNASFGVTLAVALHFIGLPNAALWGLLATVLRFVPYLGAWIAASMPVLVAFAIFDGWQVLAATVAVIVALELLVAYVVEPWLYGRSTGLSPIAVVSSAIFWTWLWGPIGLLLAMPLTVCIAAIGRHAPQFGFLNVLLGVEPVLPPAARLYHRLISFELEEAAELAEQHAREHGADSLFEEVMLPALALVESDRRRFDMDEPRRRFVFEGMRQILEELPEPGASQPVRGKGPCIVAARDDADHMAGLVLARALSAEGIDAHVVAPALLAAEVVEELARHGPQMACISVVPPSAGVHAAYLCRRLRKRFPQMTLVVALWHAEEDLARLRERLAGAGANEVVTTLAQALQQARSASQ